jgi:cytosine/uracil/thiamine/allantoin permease
VPAETFPGWLNGLYFYAWFVGLIVGGGTYYLMMKNHEK